MEGVQYDNVGDRVLCDECATAIPNLLRHCEACGIDLCVACCAARRAAAAPVPEVAAPAGLAACSNGMVQYEGEQQQQQQCLPQAIGAGPALEVAVAAGCGDGGPLLCPGCSSRDMRLGRLLPDDVLKWLRMARKVHLTAHAAVWA